MGSDGDDRGAPPHAVTRRPGPRRASARVGRVRGEAAVVIDRIERGEDPMPAPPEPEPTVADLAERFLRVHVKVNHKPSTPATYRGHLDCHILPALGERALGAVGRGESAALHHRLRDTPPTANAVVRTMFHLAEAWELVPLGRNPCRSVRLYEQRWRERFMTPDEYRCLGRVLKEAERGAARCGRRRSPQSGCSC